MRPVGYSTGAIAKGDFRRGLYLQADFSTAVELSALRETELDVLVDALPKLDLSGFEYVSIHAPSRLAELSETQVVSQLLLAAKYVPEIVLHPDVVQTPSVWKPLEEYLLFENMDLRKPIAQTADEMNALFEEFPAARFCFDIGHARQTDSSMKSASRFLELFTDRLAELHVSEVNANSRHVPIGENARRNFEDLAERIPQNVPVIIESDVTGEQIEGEFHVVREIFG